MLLPTVAEIRRSVQSGGKGFNIAVFQHSIDAVRAGWQDTGDHEAGVALLEFVKDLISDLLLEPEPSVPEIRDAGTLLQAVLRAPSAVRALTFLRKHREMVTPDLFEQALSKVIPGGGNDQMPAIARAVNLIAAVLNEPRARVKGLLLWSSLCRTERRFGAAERHLRRAARLAANLQETETRMLVLGAQAGFYRALRRPREAIEVLEEALKVAAGDRIVVIGLQDALSSCYRETGQSAKALDALTAMISLLGDDFPEKRYEALNLRGLLYEDLGLYDKGMINYEAALTVAQNLSDRGRQFEAMNNRAASFLKRGMAREGYRAFQEALRTVERWGNPAMIASTHNNLGTALSYLERYAEARSEFGQALRFKINSGDKNGEFICFQGMGDAQRDLGDIEGARLSYALALVAALEIMDGSLLASITIRNCSDPIRQAEKIDETIASLKWARQLYQRQTHLVQELLQTSQLINCYVESGRISEALSECREVLGSRLFDLELHGALSLFVQCIKLRAAEPGGWKTNFDLLLERMKKIDSALDDAVIDARRAEIISDSLSVYSGLIELLAAPEAANAMAGAASPMEVAFDLHESAKSRSFLAAIADAPIDPPATIPEVLRQREEELLQKERGFQESSSSMSETYRDELLRQTRDELRKCWDEMSPFSPAYVRSRSGAPYTFREIAALLPKAGETETVFASFFVDERRTTCFIVREGADAPEMFTFLLGRNDLTQIAKQIRRVFNGAPDEFPPYPPIRGDMPFRRKLDFLGPLCDAMSEFFKATRGSELILVAPHGPLHLIPLHILRGPDGKYLAENAAVVYTPSLSANMQILLRQTDSANKNSKIPVFAAGVSSADDIRPEYFENDAQLFDPERWDVSTAFGVMEATRHSVLSRLSQMGVVHLSCHGFFDNRSPLNSGLVFSNGQTKAPRNPHDIPFLERQAYLVTVRDIMKARLNAGLVTLSACSSGLQAVRNAGDEMDGFSRAILAAGASAALLTMWNVDQESAQDFLTNFYAHLDTAGSVSGKWRALHAAQLDFIFSDDEKLRHPYHWAPFALIGDWR